MFDDDRQDLTVRLAALQGVVVAVLVTLAVGFWFFQVAQYNKFRELADNNHQRVLPLRAPRGVIFDRDGEAIVENRYSFNISLVRERTARWRGWLRSVVPTRQRSGGSSNSTMTNRIISQSS